jgi:hypothetical protein
MMAERTKEKSRYTSKYSRRYPYDTFFRYIQYVFKYSHKDGTLHIKDNTYQAELQQTIFEEPRQWHEIISSAKFTYLRTPWRGVIFEKLTGCQLVKQFPAFYGTRKFITAFTSARHLSLF